tara:strand:- start:292 stop:612 length:321 start_codon:yes stop_codon:yes gene_type:complete
MGLTGKCREDFEKWYTITYFKNLTPLSIQEHCTILECFDDCFESMQYGVYVDFFDSVGIVIDICSSNFCSVFYVYLNKKTVPVTTCRTRPEARMAAIEKANEIYNK